MPASDEARERANAKARAAYAADPAVRLSKTQRSKERSREWTVILQASRTDPVVGSALKMIRERLDVLSAAAAAEAAAAAAAEAAAAATAEAAAAAAAEAAAAAARGYAWVARGTSAASVPPASETGA